MRHALRAVVACAALAACGAESGAGRAATADSLRPSGHVGAPAPALEGRTLDGRAVSLDSLRGTPVLVNVWATWCHPCQDEIPVLASLYTQYRPRGLEVIGVSIDDDGRTADIRAFASRYGVNYPIWHDPDQRVMPAFSVIGVPTTFLIGRTGRILWRKTGEVKAGDPSLAAALDSALAS